MKKTGFIVVMVCMLAGYAAAGEDAAASYEFGTVRVTIAEKSFDPRRANVETCQGGAGICRINGVIPFGVAAGVPKTMLAKVTVQTAGKTYELETGGMYNAWGGKTDEAGQRLSAKCFDPNNCIVRGVFSVTAGAYVAEWAIVDGRASRTMLTGSRDVVELFKKHIEPPLFE